MDKNDLRDLALEAENKSFSGSVRHYINELCTQHGFSNPNLLTALYTIISKGDPNFCVFDYAVYTMLQRYRMGIKVYGTCTRDTEIMAQATRWGLFGIYGHRFRNELKVTSVYLPYVLDVETNIDYAIRLLISYYNLYFSEHGWDGVIAAFDYGKVKLRQQTHEIVNIGFVNDVKRQEKRIIAEAARQNAYNKTRKGNTSTPCASTDSPQGVERRNIQ